MKLYIELLLVILISAGLVSCTEDGANSDATEEQACSTVTGKWQIASVTCDGVPEATDGIIFDFFEPETMRLTSGSPMCSSTHTNSLSFGPGAAIDIVGADPVTCGVGSSTSATCSGDKGDCDSAVDMTGVKISFSECSLQGELSVVLKRTVTAAHIAAGGVACSEGQTEVYTLNTYDDTPKAYLAIDDLSTYDFGDVNTSSTASNTFYVTNYGDAPATDIEVLGINLPFDYVGGTFPGTSATLGDTLPEGQVQSLNLSFTPLSTGPKSGTIQLNYSNGVNSQLTNREMIGTGI